MVEIPREITAGDTVSWVDHFPSYSSHQYILSYSLRGNSILDLAAIALGSTFKTTITSIQSSTLVAGIYFFQAYLVEIATGNRQSIGHGQIKVNANLAATSTIYDGSSFAEKTLLAIQNTIKAKLEGGAVMEYRIGTRMVKNFTLKELTDMEVYWRNRVLKEQVGRGDRPNPENLYIGWSNPSRRGYL